MAKTKHFITRLCIYAFACVVAISCKDDDEFFDRGSDSTVDGVANAFDFSTTQDVDLIVDYSAFHAKTPVFFSVYNVNPFVNENKADEYIDESIKPIYAAYTEPDGKYDQTVTLPAYAKVLHIVTGNFLVGLRRTVVEVVNGQARAIVDNPLANAKSRMTRAPWRVKGTGSPTNDITKMKNLYEDNGTQYYKPWYTPLGTWDSHSGRPDYLLDKSTAAPGLVFSDEEFDGLYATACSALNSGTEVKETYRANSDMTVTKDSEISITMLGSSTCWNSSLGYYYYTGDAPTNKMDLNIIMIFPNTQDGEWPRGSYPNNDYRGNIGTLRGDVVQLKYYPNIANGDFSGETTMFPAGTKIGFILKSNGWGCLGKDYAVNGSYSNYKPVWATSTDGLSTSKETGKKFSNPNGESRTAKFSFDAVNGNKYAIISFEDANDDKDYDDLVFALNPANAFTDVAGIESRQTSTYGVYGFEDKWPMAHDYDMNDALIQVEHVKEFYAHAGADSTLVKETFNFTTDHNYVTEENSFGVKLNTKAQIATIYVNKAATGTAPDPSAATSKTTINSGLKSAVYSHPNFTTVMSSSSDANGIYYFYFNDLINNDRGKTTYSIEVTYNVAQSDSKASVKAFLCRKEGSSYWEVHPPFDAPGPKVKTSYFGTKDDRSDYANKKNLYTSENEYPFGFYLDGVKMDDLRSTLLNPANESVPIDQLFPLFIDWSKSNGIRNQNWYKQSN